MYQAESVGKVVLMQKFDPCEVSLEGFHQGFGQHGDSVFLAFAFADRDLEPVEVDVFDTEAEALQDSQTGTVQQGRHDSVGAGHVLQDAVCFLAGEHDR